MRLERGSATVVMAAVVGLLAVVAIATSGMGILFAARTQAQTAAEAAALAAAVATYPPTGASAPRRAAREAAEANHALVVRCDCPVNTGLEARVVLVSTVVRVDVPVLGLVAVGGMGRAEFDPIRWLGY